MWGIDKIFSGIILSFSSNENITMQTSMCGASVEEKEWQRTIRVESFINCWEEDGVEHTLSGEEHFGPAQIVLSPFNLAGGK